MEVCEVSRWDDCWLFVEFGRVGEWGCWYIRQPPTPWLSSVSITARTFPYKIHITCFPLHFWHARLLSSFFLSRLKWQFIAAWLFHLFCWGARGILNVFRAYFSMLNYVEVWQQAVAFLSFRWRLSSSSIEDIIWIGPRTDF